MYRSAFCFRNPWHCWPISRSDVRKILYSVRAPAFISFARPGIGRAVAILMVAFALIGFTRPQCAHAAGAEVPFGEKVGPAFTNYDRIRPTIATAGVLKDGAVGSLRPLGFAAVLDLRGPTEGTASEKVEVESASLRYFNIPVTEQAPSDEQVVAFAGIVEDPANQPIIIHCHSASRVGAMWVLYQVRKGAPVAIALEEGRTIGLQPDREKAVRARLGEPVPK
jgi:protein tyrosine phosphatase (PTP) superfamily phosphohydrolase (DUF442 family)